MSFTLIDNTHWENNASIYLEGDNIELDFDESHKDEIFIQVSWDYGWGGRGTESTKIPIALLKKAIEIWESR